ERASNVPSAASGSGYPAAGPSLASFNKRSTQSCPHHRVDQARRPIDPLPPTEILCCGGDTSRQLNAKCRQNSEQEAYLECTRPSRSPLGCGSRPRSVQLALFWTWG